MLGKGEVGVLLNRKLMVSMQVAAAITIQAMWKKYKWQSWYLELKHRRHDAARRFQNLWRNYRFRNILPIIRRRQ